MTEAILALAGVLLGGIISFASTYYWENKRWKEEKGKKALETLKSAMQQYITFWDKLRKETFFDQNLDEIIKYYYGEFSEMRLSNKVNEVLFLNEEQKNYIREIDQEIDKWIGLAEERGLLGMPGLSEELRTQIDGFEKIM